jgi:hypothetical protein
MLLLFALLIINPKVEHQYDNNLALDHTSQAIFGHKFAFDYLEVCSEISSFFGEL